MIFYRFRCCQVQNKRNFFNKIFFKENSFLMIFLQRGRSLRLKKEIWQFFVVSQWFSTFLDSRHPSLVNERFGITPNYNLQVNRYQFQNMASSRHPFWGTPVENNWIKQFAKHVGGIRSEFFQPKCDSTCLWSKIKVIFDRKDEIFQFKKCKKVKFKNQLQ